MGTTSSLQEWPTVTLPPQVEWPTWPSVTEKVPEATKASSGQNKGVGKVPSQVYTGPNLHGLVKTPIVKQLKSVIGGVKFQSAAFLKNGHYVFTKGALTKAREDAEAKAEKAREDTKPEKDKEDGNGGVQTKFVDVDVAPVDKDKAWK
ncbi:hypothetical protein POM88_029128 [Heracleum sosnowskyi]|uniref:Uncharacterized protein n=1 Tax=Heracleum sosnowskyi TaxID=360622 RepID=A0AAD8HTA9_9APIA|nr:hypothetical protein POM88_029128 [Heracleum sosnowskyi]